MGELNDTTKIPRFRLLGRKDLNKFLLPNDVVELDGCIFTYSKSYVVCNNLSNKSIKGIYASKLNDIMYNLDTRRNPQLLIDILDKKIKIKSIPYMKSHELNKKLWEPIIQKQNYIDYKKNNMDTSDVYECRKCKKRKCKVFTMQTRSSDEPMTIIVQCENCNTSFRIY
jgi:DNA-directed RNA polymerase subunit M/transcription elongation factor TFIIS